MTYHLVNLGQNKQTTSFMTAFDALEKCFRVAKQKAICCDEHIHLSVTDDNGRQLLDLKVALPKEVKTK